MKKFHFYLVAGQVVFATKDGQTGSLLLNAVVTNSARLFPVRMIGKAQQALQIQFYKKVEDADTQVLDVPLQNIVYLGQMTDAEFHAPPEGTKIQEKPSDDPFADKGILPGTLAN